MTECVALTAEGFVQSAPADPCEGFVLVSADEWGNVQGSHDLWYPNFENAQWAAASVVFMFAIGIGVGLLLQMARKAR